jgi:endonuclease/exonuclease/phosphatase (EEP) superfamily protein YafD
MASTDPPAAAASPRKRRLSVSFWGLFSAAMFLTGVATAAGFLGRFWWPLDDAASFRAQYLASGLVGAGIYALGRRKRACAAMLALAVTNGLLLIPLYWGQSHRTLGGKPVRLLLANVEHSNRAYDRLLATVDREKPDVVLLEEVSAGWQDAMGRLRKDYPHYLESPQEDSFGIALYSRIPLIAVKKVKLGEAGLPSIEASFRVDGQVVRLLGTHPVPPVGGQYFAWRNGQFEQIAAWAPKQIGHVIVLGDLNVTPWSDHFRRLVSESGLWDCRRGFGLNVTWPAFFPPLAVPIDQCLVSPEMTVRNFRSCGSIGSDHYPVVVDLLLPPLAP